jgi:hypothetical protein
MRESIFANAFGIGRARHVPRSWNQREARAVQQVAPRAKGSFHIEQNKPGCAPSAEISRRAATPRLRMFGPWMSARYSSLVAHDAHDAYDAHRKPES